MSSIKYLTSRVMNKDKELDGETKVFIKSLDLINKEVKEI